MSYYFDVDGVVNILVDYSSKKKTLDEAQKALDGVYENSNIPKPETPGAF